MQTGLTIASIIGLVVCLWCAYLCIGDDLRSSDDIDFAEIFMSLQAAAIIGLIAFSTVATPWLIIIWVFGA